MPENTTNIKNWFIYSNVYRGMRTADGSLTVKQKRQSQTKRTKYVNTANPMG